MQEWLNNVEEEFMERFLRQRIERLEHTASELFTVMGVAEGLEPYVMNRNIRLEENAQQYQLRCRLEVAEQRFDRLHRAFKSLEGAAMNEAMRRVMEWANLKNAS